MHFLLVQVPTIIVDYGDFSLSKRRQEYSSTTGEEQNECLIHLNEPIISDIDYDMFFCYSWFKFQEVYDCGIILPSYIVCRNKKREKYGEIRKKEY